VSAAKKNDSEPEKAWAKCMRCGRGIPEGMTYFIVLSIDDKEYGENYSICPRCFSEMFNVRAVKIRAWSIYKVKEALIYEKGEGER